MITSPLDIEFNHHWPKLTPVQKKSLLSVIKSFPEKKERISIEQYNQELAEAEEEYQAGDHITSEEMLYLIKKQLPH